MVISKGGSEQIISMILKITKAKVEVNIKKYKSKGMMDNWGQKFRLYWMGENIPRIIKKRDNAM